MVAIKLKLVVWCVVLCTIGVVTQSCQEPVEPSEIGIESTIAFVSEDGSGKVVRGVELFITDLQSNKVVGSFRDIDSIGKTVVSAQINASGRFQWRVQATPPVGFQPSLLDTTIDIPCANSVQVFQFWQTVSAGCGVDAETALDHIVLPCIPAGETITEQLSFLVTNDCFQPTEFTLPAPTQGEYTFSAQTLQGVVLPNSFVLQPQESAIVFIDIAVTTGMYVDPDKYTIRTASGTQDGSVGFSFSFEVTECQGCECEAASNVEMTQATDLLCPGESETVVFDNSQVRNNTGADCEYTFELVDGVDNSQSITIVEGLSDKRVPFGAALPNVGIRVAYDETVTDVIDTIQYQVWLESPNGSAPKPCFEVAYIVSSEMGQIACTVVGDPEVPGAEADSNLVYHQVMYNCYDAIPDITKDKTIRVTNDGDCPITYDIRVISDYDSLFYFENYTTTRLRGTLEAGDEYDGKLSFYPRRNMGVDVANLPTEFFALVQIETSAGCDTVFQVVGAADTNNINCCQKNEFALPPWGADDTEGPLYLGVTFNEDNLEVRKVQDQSQYLSVVFAVESVDELTGTAVLGQAGKPVPTVYYQLLESRPVGANGAPVCAWKREFDPLDCSDAETTWEAFPEVRAGDLLAYSYEYASGVTVCGLVYVSDISRRTNDRLPDVKLIFPPPDRD